MNKISTSLALVAALLPEHWRAVIRTAYVTGWRVRSEIFTRKWEHVDLNAGWIRLDPGETKNGDGRMFPLVPDLRRVLERQRELTSRLERETDQVIPWVFHRNGVPLKDIRTAWKTATKKAGLAGRIPHDFRRTAIRNLNRAGVPRSDAMAMVGHRTEAVYRRYSISDEQSLRESGEKLAALHEDELQNETKIVPLHKRAK